MPVFNLSEDNIKRLREKFREFQEARTKIHKLILNYVADYGQFKGTPEDKKEFLENKYGKLTPGMTHLAVFDGSEIYFHVQDIAIILGRTQPAISITLSKLENSPDYAARLISLRKITKSANNNKIFVYKKEIFDLIIDRYEEEYIARFSSPRRGSKDNAPDINEVRKFWNYLRQLEEHNNLSAVQNNDENKISLPDIPAMRFRDILKLIWEKVFDIKIWTLCTVIFAACFEIARRFSCINLYFAVVPAVLIFACVILIHSRKFRPDILSDIGAGALLFMLLWIGALTPYKSDPPKVAQNIVLSPSLRWNGLDSYVYFNISAADFSDIRELMFRISPDVQFRSTGFLNQTDALHNLPYPDRLIRNNNIYHGIALIDVKYSDFTDNESDTWHFSFDVDAERVNLCKQHILKSDENWFRIIKYSYNNITDVFVNPDLLISMQGKNSIKSFVYGINTDKPDTEVEFQYFYEGRQMSRANPYAVLSTEDDNVKLVSSYLIFKDGTSSDIRIDRAGTR